MSAPAPAPAAQGASAGVTPGGPPAGNAGEDGGAPKPTYTQNRRLMQTQAQVEEVVDIMRVNVEKVLDRDAKISNLDDRADALQAGASQFEASAGKLKNKYWWKNMKMMIVMGVIAAIIIIIIITLEEGNSEGHGPMSLKIPENRMSEADVE